MKDDDTILELDYSSKKKSIFSSAVTYISLIVFLILLSSYKNPTTRINNNLIISSSIQVQNLLKTHISSLNNQSIEDTIANINNQLNALLVEFYMNRDFQPAWLENFNTNQQFASILNIASISTLWFPTT